MEAPALAAPRRLTGQRLFVLALLAVFITFGVQYAFKVTRHRSAFVRWRNQVLELDSGTDIYRTYQYPNPPIMALLLRPLAELDPVAGAMLWFTLKAAMALLALAAVFRLVEAGGVSFPPWARAVTAVISLRPIAGDLSHGNVNILILFLVVAALYAWHHGRDFLAGLILALAICCKVTPALFVPYFLWKRQFRLLFGCFVGLGLFLFEIPGAALGWDENLSRLESWTNQMVVPYLRDGVVSSEHPNQSLPGVVHRLLTRSPSFSDYPNDVYTPTEYHNVADIGRGGARWVIRGAQLLFGLLIVLLGRTPTTPRGGWRLSVELAVVLVGMLLFSERTWKHHCVTLLLPFAVLVYAIAARPLGRGVKIGIGVALGSALALMVSASGLLDTRSADLAQVYGAYTWAFLLLLAACGLAIHGDNRSMTQPAAVRR